MICVAVCRSDHQQGEFVQRRDAAQQTESYWHPTGGLDRRGILLRGSPRPSPTGLSLLRKCSLSTGSLRFHRTHLISTVTQTNLRLFGRSEQHRWEVRIPEGIYSQPDSETSMNLLIHLIQSPHSGLKLHFLLSR